MRRSRLSWPLEKSLWTSPRIPLSIWVITLKSLSHLPSGPSFSALASRASSCARTDLRNRAGSHTMFSLCFRLAFR
jgi:hypothetical protein